MDRQTYLRQARITVTIHRDRDHTEQLVGTVRKSWWGGPGVGGLSRPLAEHWIDVGNSSEPEAIAAMLIDLGLALRGGLYAL